MNEFERMIRQWKNQYRNWQAERQAPKTKRPDIKMCPVCGRFNNASDGECAYCQAVLRPKPMATVSQTGETLEPINPVVVLFGVCAFAYFLSALLTTQQGERSILSALWSPDMLLEMGANNGHYVLNGHEWWRTLTYGMLHGGAMHLFMNFSALGSLGLFLWQTEGTARFWLITLFTTWTGGVTSACSVFFWGSYSSSIGLSGALFGYLGALYMHFRLQGHVGYADQFKRYMIVGNVFCIIVTILGFPIDNFAHIGGMLGGMGLVYLLNSRVLAPIRQDFERASLALLTGFFGYGLYRIITGLLSS